MPDKPGWPAQSFRRVNEVSEFGCIVVRSVAREVEANGPRRVLRGGPPDAPTSRVLGSGQASRQSLPGILNLSVLLRHDLHAFVERGERPGLLTGLVSIGEPRRELEATPPDLAALDHDHDHVLFARYVVFWYAVETE